MLNAWPYNAVPLNGDGDTTVAIVSEQAVAIGVSQSETVTTLNLAATDDQAVSIGVGQTETVLGVVDDGQTVALGISQSESIASGLTDDQSVTVGVSQTESLTASVLNDPAIAIGVTQTEAILANSALDQTVQLGVDQTEAITAAGDAGQTVSLSVNQTEAVQALVSDWEAITLGISQKTRAIRPLTVRINGVVQDYRVRRGSISVTENVRGKPNTASLEIIKRRNEAPPSHSQVLSITDHLGALLFEGFITVIDQQQEGFDDTGRFLYWPIQAADYELLAHKAMFVGRFVNKTRGAIIRTVCRAKAPDVDTSLVPDGPVIPAVSFDYLYPAEIIKQLCDFDGSVYSVDYQKRLVISSAIGNTALVSLTPTSANHAGLTVTVDRTTLKNSVIVKGGQQPGRPVTQTWTGDGVEGNYSLTHTPYAFGPTTLFEDRFSGTKFDDKWLQFDIPNPTPTPNRASAEGYLFTGSTHTSKYTSLQIVGGPGAYGQVGLVSAELFPRKAGYSFRFALIVSTAGDMTLGLSDGTSADLATIRHGVRFKGAGALSRMEAGTETALSQTYAPDALTEYQVRIDVKAAGATYYLQGGAYGSVGGPDWTQIADTSTDTMADLAVAILVSSGQAAVYNVVYEAPPYNATLTVSGVNNGLPLSLGYDPVDSNGGVYALINAQDLRLRFFGSDPGPATIPPAGATITLSYTPAIPIVTEVIDADSIAAMAALDGTDGVWQSKIVDNTIASLSEANARGQAEINEFANPDVAVGWTMPWGTYDWAQRPKAGQIIAITTGGLNSRFLIQSVQIKHQGNEQYTLTVRAGSKLRGLEDYLQRLIADGKRFPQQPTKLDFMASFRDRLSISAELRLFLGPRPFDLPLAIGVAQTRQVRITDVQPSGVGSVGFNAMTFNGVA